MTNRRLIAWTAAALGALLLAACGGGNSGVSQDTSPLTPPTASATGADKFLLFPNPQVLDDGSLQTNSTAYAQAYYAAIDPLNEKDTLEKWKAANKFDTGTGTQIMAVFGDQRDLGYGRRMTARKNTDGTIAFLVENYQTDPGGAYGFNQLSVEAAIREDTRWRILINAIEFSPGPLPNNGVSFAKFFNFNPVTGQRETSVDLDGRGLKAMPGPCVTCHGGRGDALSKDASGNPVFSLVENSASSARGDVQAHFAPLEVDGFAFSTIPGFSREEQEARLKTMNTYVLCSYPVVSATAFAEDACRRVANRSEWQGTAADLIKHAYGGDNLPSLKYDDTVVPFLPDDWKNANQPLYQDVVAPACRGCHLLRGTGAQSDIDFDTFTGFQGFAGRIKAHVIDRGDMPLAKIVYDRFWSANNPGPPALAKFLGLNSVQEPGRPVADPGPDRVTTQQGTKLSATGSLFANAFEWSIVTAPPGASPSFSSPNSAKTTFNTNMDGNYVLQLVASNATQQSAPAQLRLFVNNALFTPQFPAPDQVRFSDVKNVLQSAVASCRTCHTPDAVSPLVAGPPLFFVDPGGGDKINQAAFYADVRSRVNFADIVASPLLTKPSGSHHFGSLLPGFDASLDPGVAGRVSYDLFLNWILNGAKE